MRPKLLVQIRQAYGQHRTYPVNLIARQFATLLGRKTFRDQDLYQISVLGFEIEYFPEHLEVPDNSKEEL